MATLNLKKRGDLKGSWKGLQELCPKAPLDRPHNQKGDEASPTAEVKSKP